MPLTLQPNAAMQLSLSGRPEFHTGTIGLRQRYVLERSFVTIGRPETGRSLWTLNLGVDE